MDDDKRPPSEKCPACGDRMRLALVVPRVAKHPELHSYKCVGCNEVVTRPVQLGG